MRVACFVLLTLTAHAFASSKPLDLDWKDATRDRVVPVRVYLPTDAKPAPVVIFSHGLGGSREGYSFLGTYWADHGYVAVHVQHVGSDTSVWLGAGAKARERLTAAANPKELTERVADVKFALDQLTSLNNDPKSPLHARLDLAHIAMAGHSFGASTTQALMGEVFPVKATQTWADPRICCAIVMSPSPPERRSRTDAAFGKITMPVLYITGTKDDSPIGDIKAADRPLPYESSPPGDKYLITFTDADHMVFAGAPRLRGALREIDKTDQPLIQKATTAFLDAYLKGDRPARRYLQDAFVKEAGGAASVQAK